MGTKLPIIDPNQFATWCDKPLNPKLSVLYEAKNMSESGPNLCRIMQSRMAQGN